MICTGFLYFINKKKPKLYKKSLKYLLGRKMPTTYKKIFSLHFLKKKHFVSSRYYIATFYVKYLRLNVVESINIYKMTSI